jgi:hypothetical protein
MHPNWLRSAHQPQLVEEDGQATHVVDVPVREHHVAEGPWVQAGLDQADKGVGPAVQ